MTKDIPMACSLDAGELEQRLAAIAEVGANNLISSDTADGSHLLRFPADTTTRRRLEDIVVAEAECCAFLDLSLSEEGDELHLSIGAPKDAQQIADELAGAFSPGRPHE